jgi:hypothetical protein
VQSCNSAGSVGFPPDVDWGEAIDWDYLAAEHFMDDGQVFFHFVAVDSGVYVFDITHGDVYDYTG